MPMLDSDCDADDDADSDTDGCGYGRGFGWICRAALFCAAGNNMLATKEYTWHKGRYSAFEWQA
jgi:hypothetical protein